MSPFLEAIPPVLEAIPPVLEAIPPVLEAVPPVVGAPGILRGPYWYTREGLMMYVFDSHPLRLEALKERLALEKIDKVESEI